MRSRGPPLALFQPSSRYSAPSRTVGRDIRAPRGPRIAEQRGRSFVAVARKRVVVGRGTRLRGVELSSHAADRGDIEKSGIEEKRGVRDLNRRNGRMNPLYFVALMTASMEAFSPSWHGTQRLSPLPMSTTEKSALVSNQDIALGDQGFSSRRIRNFSSKCQLSS